MNEISRHIAEKFFKKELFCTINGFKGMTFNEVIDKRAKFFLTKDFIISYVELDSVIIDLLLTTQSRKVNFRDIDRHFSKIGKNIFVEFKNKRLKRILKMRYKNRIVEYKNNNLILIFEEGDESNGKVSNKDI